MGCSIWTDFVRNRPASITCDARKSQSRSEATKQNAQLGVVESRTQAKDGAEMEMMPVTAPFLVEDASTHNQLSVVISESTPTDIDISIYNMEGDVICSIPETVPAHSDIVLQLRDKLAHCGAALPVRARSQLNRNTGNHRRTAIHYPRNTF